MNMPNVRLHLACCSLLATLLVVPLSAEDGKAKPDDNFQSTVKPFLNEYCKACHGDKKQKGERRFDHLPAEILDDGTLVDFQDILDQLNLDEMPPEDARQPSADESRAVIDWLTKRIASHHQARQAAGDETVLRRLNAREYRNTVRDLLKLEMTIFDPTLAFPRDQTTEHLDNIGETLVTSGHLLARYLDAAEQVVNKAMTPLVKPEIQAWSFRDHFKQQPEIDQVHGKTNGFSHITLYDVVGADKPEGAYGPILAFREGVPLDGMYEIRIKAEAVNRLHPYDPEFLGTDPDEPLRLGIVGGNDRAGPLHKPQPIEPLLAEIDLADEPQWYAVRVWLDAGYTPRFTFRNGLMDVRNLWSQLLRKYADQFPARKNSGIVEARFNAIKYGKLPQIHIHEVEIKGPFYDAWPTASQRALLGDDWENVQRTGELSEQRMRERLTAFASRAYRRPAKRDEIDRVMQVITRRRAAGQDILQAYADGLKTILCSPNFLYLDEQASADSSLTSHALASRLSYFLWSSMPDGELFELAASDKLRQPDVLASQAERMLEDRKSTAFVDGFLDSWLTLRDLGSMPPDRSKFEGFYHYDLGDAMRQETRLFTRYLLDHNLSVANFLDSDFTFVNKPLAKLYGCEPPTEGGFQRVTISDHRRGGLLGQASILTVTANGIDTSPVARGVWLLENILGTPPSPPPPDVEPLDPDIRGAKTIRDQLRKHRDVASCYDCHRKIDPLGFALESFDPIGRWRETYDGNAPIDPSGELPNGRSFDDVSELKAILVEQRSQFVKSLTGKMLAYALGRHSTPADRPHIDAIVAACEAKGDGLRSLVTLVVLSEPFRSK